MFFCFNLFLDRTLFSGFNLGLKLNLNFFRAKSMKNQQYQNFQDFNHLTLLCWGLLCTYHKQPLLSLCV